MKIFKTNICKGWTCVSECVSATAGLRESDHASAVCVVELGLHQYSQALLHTSQVYEYVHRTKVTNLLPWLMCFLWMPSLPHFFIGAVFGPTFCSLCICQSTLTNCRKLKGMDFWWSQWHYLHVIFGHNVKQSRSCNLTFRETVHDNPSQHVLIMPAQCRWHYVGYPLSYLSVEQILLPPNLSAFHLREYCGQTVSCLSQQQVESLLLACNGCIKGLSTLG